MAPSSYREHRLPPGRHRLSAGEVAANQRRRLIAAAGEVFAERGVAGTTSRAIANRAAVSSSSFYARFDSVDDVLAASSLATGTSLLAAVAGACDEAPEPSAKPAAALGAAAGFLAAQAPHRALLGLELATAIAAAAHQREALLENLAGSLGSIGTGAEGSTAIAVHLVAAALGLLVDRPPGGSEGQLGSLPAELGRLLT